MLRKEQEVVQIIYRVFCQNYNFSIIISPKTTSEHFVISKYNGSYAEDKIAMDDDYQNHFNRKMECHSEKENQHRSNNDSLFMSFYHQSVLHIATIQKVFAALLQNKMKYV